MESSIEYTSVPSLSSYLGPLFHQIHAYNMPTAEITEDTLEIQDCHLR